jgi:rhodanese-related sulfurtransferase
MQKLRTTFIWIWIGISLLVGCQSSPAKNQPALSPDANAATAEEGTYWTLVEQAQDAYIRADYETAVDSARQAVRMNPDEGTAWEIYSQAVIAQAGNTYLKDLPDRRYQLPIDVFVRDTINHSRAWTVIDVREPDEYTAGHIEGAVNIPLRDLIEHLYELPNSKTSPILLYCHSQKRATHALVVLHELGYLKVFNLEGGYAAYEEWMNSNPLPTPGPTPTPGPDEPDLGC